MERSIIGTPRCIRSTLGLVVALVSSLEKFCSKQCSRYVKPWFGICEVLAVKVIGHGSSKLLVDNPSEAGGSILLEHQ